MIGVRAVTFDSSMIVAAIGVRAVTFESSGDADWLR